MTEGGREQVEEISALEMDDEGEEPDDQSDTSGASSTSAPYSTTGRSQYALAL